MCLGRRDLDNPQNGQCAIDFGGERTKERDIHLVATMFNKLGQIAESLDVTLRLGKVRVGGYGLFNSTESRPSNCRLQDITCAM